MSAHPAFQAASLRTTVYSAIEPANFENALVGKVALVTGSGRGIGKGIAKALATAGASICITARTQSQIDEAVKEVQEVAYKGAKVIGVAADGLKHDDLEMLVKKVRSGLPPCSLSDAATAENQHLFFLVKLSSYHRSTTP